MPVNDPERLGAMDLNLLAALDALLTERSVTEAAARRRVRQPAMSSSLSRLRRLFNDPLFVRDGSRLVPTPLADSLAGPVADALTMAHALRTRSETFDPATDERALSAIASDYVSVVLLHPILKTLQATAPGVTIDVRSVPTDIDRQLRRGTADVAVAPRSVIGSPAGLESSDLFTDRNVFVVDAQRTDVGDRLTHDDLQSMPLVTYRGGMMATVSVRELGRPPANQGMDLTTRSFVSAAFMIAGTRTAALMPARLAHRLAGPAGIRIVEAPKRLPPFAESMYWAQHRRSDPALLWLREQLDRVSAALAEEEQ
ncbi:MULTISPECIES: LysR substrate-binding domain-containing protein [unclassified Rhodococcus (in: high G+C Gram-positive bacteria)]|uniref:LysR substrate-binding domain-containing protein n=1 Tax=unclassified Rhodococcus (in: high G+C Gram-positive bacteria) TaxID=192944 RepID=UPI0015C60002|nr:MULTISPECIES: LysR substrate-binding domain-containing protein [unclassified Rhodococcus (in: high G+C Gram-positive bacteria)]